MVLGLFALASVGAAGQSRTYALGRIEVVGAKRFTPAQVVTISGLKAGTSIVAIDVERARQRLLDFGVFVSVGYRYKMSGYSLTVIFDVEEAAWNTPVLFDNFVWFTDGELTKAAARALPTFDGKVPDQPRALMRLSAALERLLKEAGVVGTVSYVPVSQGPGVITHVRVRADVGRPIPICTVELQGAADGRQPEIDRSIQALVGEDYSKDYVRRRASENLVPHLRALGHLQAIVREVSARRAASPSPACDGGAAVTVMIDEGPIYNWAPAVWTGATVFPPADLERRLGMRAGELADASKINAGFKAVADDYRRLGRVAVVLSSEVRFDEARQLVTYVNQVEEGPRYLMGSLTILGLDATLAERLKAAWRIGRGEVLDGLYPAEFQKDVRARERDALRPFPTSTAKLDLVPGTQTANVVLTYEK